MAIRNANISRNIYDEANEYVKPIFQQGPNKPPVDADFNEGMDSFYVQLRRILELFGTGATINGNDGFKIIESVSNNVNNLTIKGGDGSDEGAGRLFHKGFMSLLKSDIEWDTNTEAEAERVHERSTGLAATTLTFSGANWSVNEHAGRQLIPNVVNGTGFTIASNTIDTITISSGDMTTVATLGDVFRVDPSTPGGARTDKVYLDIYLDEIDTDEDTNLKHPIVGGSPFESALRDRLKHIVQVRENAAAPTGTYLDPDGNLHFYILLATLNRDADSDIEASEITDEINRDLLDVASMSTEITDARGSQPSVDTRLDESLNEDGSLKASAVALALPRFRGISDIVFMPKDTAWATVYRLHQARGMFHSEWPNGVGQRIGPYRNFDLDHANYPIDVTFGTGPGPGGADNSNPAASSQTWYNVYLIGKDDGALALVYSDVTRAPFNKGGGTTAGPLLDNSTYDFPTNGWKYWSFVAALINDPGTFEIVPLRKIGNHVQYEQAQEMLNNTVNQGTFTQLSIGQRIPETSMRANLMLSTDARNDGSVDFQVRAASVQSASEKMLLQDPGLLSSKSQAWKLRCRANSNAAGSNDQTEMTGWTATDNFQRIDYLAAVGGAGTHEYWLYVLGYEEYADFGSGEPTWP